MSVLTFSCISVKNYIEGLTAVYSEHQNSLYQFSYEISEEKHKMTSHLCIYICIEKYKTAKHRSSMVILNLKKEIV